MIENPLPSPYLCHPCGLMHLPRLIEKIRRHWAGTLSPDYAKTLGRGFDDLLSQHLGVPVEVMMEAVRAHPRPADLDVRWAELFPHPLRAHEWNRKLVQRGLVGYSLERLDIRKRELHLVHRTDILTMCDLLEVAEGRLP
jgi:hypothetical protein